VRQMSSSQDEESGRVGDINDEREASGRFSLTRFRRRYPAQIRAFIIVFAWLVWTA
jgi:hypothetical protein